MGSLAQALKGGAGGGGVICWCGGFKMNAMSWDHQKRMRESSSSATI